MPVLKRGDGIDFTVQNVREILVTKKASLLKREVRFLAKNNGEYVHLQRPDLERIEATFSTDAGYPLGEVAWRYFNNAANMIYCEALPEGDQAVLVVVRESIIYLDAILPISTLVDEFSGLLAEPAEYDIFVYGDVPLTAETTEESFSFDPSFVHSFTTLDSSAFDAFPAYSDLRLTSADRAIQGLGLSKVPMLIGATLAVLVVFGLISLIFMRAEKPTQQKIISRIVKVDPYIDYEQALTTPSPQAQIDTFIKNVLELSMSVPGWRVSDIVLNSGFSAIVLEPEGGSVSQLSLWAQKNNMEFKFDQDKPLLKMQMNLPNRAMPHVIQRINDIIATVIDRMMQLAPDNQIKISPTLNKGIYKQATLDITFAKITPALLHLYGRQLHGLAVNLEILKLTNDQGILDGTLTLTVYGN